jgi:NTP pyrophosphatase (non-canonical NTP hydrolase)
MDDKDLGIHTLKEWVQTFCEQRDWDQFHGAKDLAIGLVTEASELLEIFRFQSEEQISALLNSAQDREAMADELADSLFFILRFAARFDFDLTTSLRNKIAKNERKYPIEKAFGNNKKRQ